MELRDYIEQGIEKAGSLTALGNRLGLSQPNMSHAKAHRAALPLDAACKLADYIGAPLRAVLAANELATEKKEEKRSFWEEWGRAAVWILGIAFLVVTNFVTPTPANAEPVLQSQSMPLYYVKLSMLLSHAKRQLQRLKQACKEALSPRLALGVGKV